MTESTITAHFVTKHAPEHPVHGVFGGPTPQGLISMALFSERVAIPQEVDIIVSAGEGATVITEGESRGKMGVVRTVNGVFYLDVRTAESLASWLMRHVEQIKAAQDV